MPLRELELPVDIATSTNNVLREFYIPALARAVRYDRGVGFFSSRWLQLAAEGLAGLADNGGLARVVVSPILDAADWEAFRLGQRGQDDPAIYESLRMAVDSLEKTLRSDTLAAISWMIADGLLEIRLAIPTGDLDGDFHDKFGIFSDAAGDKIAFHGSPNESQQAFRNYEAISIFCSWQDKREANRVVSHENRFNRIWTNTEPNLRVFPLPEAIRQNLAQLRTKSERPYRKPDASLPEISKWRHQEEAVEQFLAAKRGVLEMATGTGKTRTALKIFNRLVNDYNVRSLIVSAEGVDLLDQWYDNVVQAIKISGRRFRVLRHFQDHHDRQEFLLEPRDSVLLISRSRLDAVLRKMTPEELNRSFIIHDEVHGLGSPGNVQALNGLSEQIPYRLGLSATPEREYDEAGNQFILQNVGDVIFRFGVEDAIRRRILCEFVYFQLQYSLTPQDRQAQQEIYRMAAARKAAGDPMPQEELWTALAKVPKKSKAKLPLFARFLAEHPEVLTRCIIFVEDREYGEEVLKIVHRYQHNFHTYYAGDKKETLLEFASGEIECLVTCERISEGIDIRSVRSIVLFSADRARLQTIQRIGRCLRIDPDDPEKRSSVVDFVRAQDPDDQQLNSDQLRAQWLSGLSQIKGER